MTGDERDRILGLLSAGPATVGRLAAGLALPGGVVSYQLTLLEREGLVRVGTTRAEHGVATSVWVSTAAAAPPPLRIPRPLPGLTFTGDGPYPVPLWTARRPAEPIPAADEPATHSPDRPPSGAGWAAETRDTPSRPATGAATTTSPAPQPRRPDPEESGAAGRPRLSDVRRVPVDDATFYEFASRLDALAREFAARATPGAPATELTIALTRPLPDGAAGYGS